jgi:zinc protease
MNTPPRLRDVRFSKTTLPNGLDVILQREPRLPLAAVNLWYHVGSKNEERRHRGFAHLFEHLMFEGSEHFPGDYFQPLQRLGASVNGSTSVDRTNYFVDLPPAHLELVVAMESDRMGHLLPALTDAKLRIQKDVVKNEYRQNYGNRPYGEVSRLLAEALYPPHHPYSWITIGVMEEVEAASRMDVEAFFRRYYVPSNASLCIAGDIDEDRALRLAERYFAELPGGSKALPVKAPPIDPQEPEVVIQLNDRVELDRLYLAWHTVPQFTADDAELGLLADVLARGKASRLYRRLVVEEGLAQDVWAYQAGRELAGRFEIIVALRPSKEVDRARALVCEELSKIRSQGPTDEELERARNGRVAGFVYALENIGGFGGVADRLNAYNTFLEDPGRITSDILRYATPGSAEVAAVASRYVGDKCSARLSVLGRETATFAPVDRSKRPEPAAAAAFLAPLPEERRLTCGSPLWVIPMRGLPIVAATLVTQAGAGSHARKRGGLASLTADMMDEGTTTRSSQELALAVEGMAASLSSSCGWDGSYVSLHCLSQHFEASLELACDVLCNAAFPGSEWARISAQTLAGLRAERDSAEARAHRALLKALYDVDHPYHLPIDGDETTVAGISRQDLAAFHRARYQPDRSAWVVAGDVDVDHVEDVLNRALGDWKGRAEPLPEVVSPAGPGRCRLLLLNKPGAPQAVARVGHLGLPRDHPDHDALQVLNQILGGQFTSRLNAKLREEKGFTYGVRSLFDFRRGAGPFMISASLQADRLAEALADLRDEARALLDHRPPTAVELEDARRSLIEGQARQFETSSSLVARYASLFLYGLPLDHHARLAERLSGIDVETLHTVATRHLHPESFVGAIVADAEQVEESLAGLRWGDVERVEG